MRKQQHALAAAALALCVALPGAVRAQDKPYSEGPVTEVSYIKVKPGRFNAYMKYLATTPGVVARGDRRAWWPPRGTRLAARHLFARARCSW